jgi:hypothetical protein
MRVEQTAKRPSPISPTACNRGLLDRLDIEAGDRSLKQAEPRNSNPGREGIRSIVSFDRLLE